MTEAQKITRKKYLLSPKGRARVKEQQERNRTRPSFKLRIAKYGKKLRLDCLVAYGGAEPKCACCGERHLAFLAIDHIGGGGNKHRKENNIGSGKGFYCWLRRNNFPQGFRVLCHNCNMAIGFYGSCPHQII